MARTADRGLENREIVLDILMEVLENGAYIHQILGQALYISINIWTRRTGPLSPGRRRELWIILSRLIL